MTLIKQMLELDILYYCGDQYYEILKHFFRGCLSQQLAMTERPQRCEIKEGLFLWKSMAFSP